MPTPYECRYPATTAPSPSTASRRSASTPMARHTGAPSRHSRGTSASTHSAPSGAKPRSLSRLPAGRRRSPAPAAASGPRSGRCARTSPPAAQARRACTGSKATAPAPCKGRGSTSCASLPAFIGTAACVGESALPDSHQATSQADRPRTAGRRGGDASRGWSCRAREPMPAGGHDRRPMPILSQTPSSPPRRYISTRPPASPAPRPGWYSTCGRSGERQAPPQVRPCRPAISP